jgi:hypothetical protein
MVFLPKSITTVGLSSEVLPFASCSKKTLQAPVRPEASLGDL